MSQYRPSRSTTQEPRGRFIKRCRSSPPVANNIQDYRSPIDQVVVVAQRPRFQLSDKYAYKEQTRQHPIVFQNYYGRTPSWLEDYRSHYLDSPYSQWWYDPDKYKRYQRERPDSYLDRTDPNLWRLTLDPYYDDRNLWRFASKSRQYKSDDNARAIKLYSEKLISFDDLQRNWLTKRQGWHKPKKTWWNEVGLTHRHVPSTYRFPPRTFYSFDY